MMQAKYAAMFQAGWFIESMWSQTLVIHMTRTPKLPFKKGLSQKYGAAPIIRNLQVNSNLLKFKYERRRKQIQFGHAA